jgi:hypothetical protein
MIDKDRPSHERTVYNSFGHPSVLLSSGIDKQKGSSSSHRDDLDINMTDKEKLEQDLI